MTYAFIDFLTHALTHSLTHSLTDWPGHWLTDSLTPPPTHSFTHEWLLKMSDSCMTLRKTALAWFLPQSPVFWQHSQILTHYQVSTSTRTLAGHMHFARSLSTPCEKSWFFVQTSIRMVDALQAPQNALREYSSMRTLALFSLEFQLFWQHSGRLTN